MGSAEFGSGRDMRIHHEQVKLFFTVFLVNRADQHAAGFNAHHGPRGQVGDGDAGLADELFRFIIDVNSA